MMKPAKADKFTRYNASLKISSEINKYVTFVQERCIPEEIKSMHMLPTQPLLIPGFTYTGGVHYILSVRMRTEIPFAARKVK